MPRAATTITSILLVHVLGACATESSADEPEEADGTSTCKSFTCPVGYVVRHSTQAIECSLTTGGDDEYECSAELCCQALWWGQIFPSLKAQYCDETDVSTLWSECSAPWNRGAGVNEYLPVAVQWGLCILIWSVSAFWLFFGSCCRKRGGCCRSFVIWGPVWLIVPGHMIFFGFVSHFLRPWDWMNYSLNFVCLLVAVKAKVGVPYMLGAASYVLFLLPVLTGIAKQLVHYDYGSYSIGVAYPSGVSNALTFWLVRHGWMSSRARWKVQSFGWCAIMSGIPIWSILSGEQLREYDLNLVQFIRYSAYQLSIYIFMFYGLCNHLEPQVQSETGAGVVYEDWRCESEVPLAAAVDPLKEPLQSREPLPLTTVTIPRPPGSVYNGDLNSST